MTKREIIDEIVALNPSAQPEFLAQFEDSELERYLDHLHRARQPRLLGDATRYERYFAAVSAAIEAPALEAQADEPEAVEPAEEHAELALVGAAAGPGGDTQDSPFAIAQEESSNWLF